MYVYLFSGVLGSHLRYAHSLVAHYVAITLDVINLDHDEHLKSTSFSFILRAFFSVRIILPQILTILLISRDGLNDIEDGLLQRNPHRTSQAAALHWHYIHPSHSYLL